MLTGSVIYDVLYSAGGTVELEDKATCKCHVPQESVASLGCSLHY